MPLHAVLQVAGRTHVSRTANFLLQQVPGVPQRLKPSAKQCVPPPKRSLLEQKGGQELMGQLFHSQKR